MYKDVLNLGLYHVASEIPHFLNGSKDVDGWVLINVLQQAINSNECASATDPSTGKRHAMCDVLSQLIYRDSCIAHLQCTTTGPDMVGLMLFRTALTKLRSI
jgi:hypothetical protein